MCFVHIIQHRTEKGIKNLIYFERSLNASSLTGRFSRKYFELIIAMSRIGWGGGKIT